MKSFSKGQVFASTTDSLTGQVSLEEFSTLMKQQEKKDELRQFGLTDEEISIKLKHDTVMPEQASRTTDSQETDSKSNSQKLKVIEQKIADKTEQLSLPTKFAGAKLLSRHEMDLEKAVTRDRDPTKVFDCLVTKKSVDSVDPDHPINHLDEIWKDILSSKPTCRGRKRKHGAAVDSDCETSQKINDSNMSEAVDYLNHKTVSITSATRESPESLNSNHSKQMSKHVQSSKRTCRKRKRKRGRPVVTDATASCELSVKINDSNVSEAAISERVNHKDISVKSSTRESPESLSSGHSMRSKCTVEPVPVEVIERYRLSVEQIKQLPKFQNYDAGVPSPTLYLKNLSPRVTEEDLMSLFVHFKKHDAASVIVKLLHGRMKGQAFVTFHSAETATAAMNLVNGYDFKGKPIIITYGRRTQVSSEIAAGRTTDQSDIAGSS